MTPPRGIVKLLNGAIDSPRALGGSGGGCTSDDVAPRPLQAFALMAAAEGALAAYADLTGETWKPYEAPLPASASVSRRSAAAEMAAFQAA
jgi:hypothetical protein